MTQANSLSDVVPSTTHSPTAQNFNRLQTDLVSRARIWAADEVGAAIAHQLSEPLTALLLYLHEIKARGDHSTGVEASPDSTRDMVDLAIRETQRVCDIMERLGHTFETPIDEGTAVARGREAIESLAQVSPAKANGYPSSAPSPTHRNRLTPRERETLAQITGGASNKEGGCRLGISTRTFEVHRAHIMEKLGARNAADLVRIALSKSVGD